MRLFNGVLSAHTVSMPNEKARVSIFHKLIKSGGLQTGPHFDIKACAAMTDGYTPNDIVNLLKAAACILCESFKESALSQWKLRLA